MSIIFKSNIPGWRCQVDKHLTLETEFVGSNPGLSKVVFFCWLLLHFLHHGSIQSVGVLVWSLIEVQHYWGINSQPWNKSYRDQLVTGRGDLCVGPSVGQNHRYKCIIWGKIKLCNIGVATILMTNTVTPITNYQTLRADYAHLELILYIRNLVTKYACHHL